MKIPIKFNYNIPATTQFDLKKISNSFDQKNPNLSNKQ